MPGELTYRGVYSYCRVFYEIIGRGSGGVVASLSNLPDLEAQVVRNCLIIQAAAEEFAAQNNGIYATDVGVDTTPGGDTITDLLPNGNLLENPFTKIRSEPVSGFAATGGQSGYIVHTTANGINVGYTINGWGYNGELISLTNED